MVLSACLCGQAVCLLATSGLYVQALDGWCCLFVYVCCFGFPLSGVCIVARVCWASGGCYNCGWLLYGLCAVFSGVRFGLVFGFIAGVWCFLFLVFCLRWRFTLLVGVAFSGCGLVSFGCSAVVCCCLTFCCCCSGFVGGVWLLIGCFAGVTVL